MNAREKVQIVSMTDYLAADRTLFANERTVLAYIRTVVTLVAAGISLIRFFAEQVVQITGFAILIFSAFLLAMALLRYQKNQNRLASLMEAAENDFNEKQGLD